MFLAEKEKQNLTRSPWTGHVWGPGREILQIGEELGMRVAAAQIPQAQHGGVAPGQHLRLQPAVSSIAAKVTIKQHLGRRPILKQDICNMQHIVYILKNNETFAVIKN